jgi:ribosomal-protein-alanine N-acetyltransferase
MSSLQLRTERLELFPLPREAAASLPGDREDAARIIGAKLSADWPAPDLLDVLPMQAATEQDQARYGVWVIVERDTATVIGDIGFLGPPGTDETVEIGYSIVPDRRRRGYATEAARELITWAGQQPGVGAVIAACDPDNQASIRTLERLGFARTGTAVERLRWRLESEQQSKEPQDNE